MDEDSDDGRLLTRFADAADDAAFADLVRRHGGMVHRACRQVLRDEHAADDAAQAVFIVLARQARRLGGVRCLAAWLHRVAVRIAINARTAAQRRRRHELEASMVDNAVPAPDADLAHLLPRLDEELDRLAGRYRQAVILHHLEGRAYAECARLSGCSEGAFAMRLSRAREMLRARLAGHGAALSAPALAGLLGAGAGGMPAALAAQAVAAARETTPVSAPVAALVDGAQRWLMWAKFKTAALAVAAVLALAAIPVAIHLLASSPPPAASPRPQADPRLTATLQRQVRISMPGPQPFAEAIERILRALPPGEGLEVRVLRQPLEIVQGRPIPNLEAALEVEDRLQRRLDLPAAGTVHDLLDGLGRDLGMVWSAVDETVVFQPRYAAELEGRLFAPVTDRGQPRETRQAAARAICAAQHAEGIRTLLRMLAAGDDQDAGIVLAALGEPGRSILDDDLLAAAVRQGFAPDEGERIAAILLPPATPTAVRLLGFLRAPAAVPHLVRMLAGDAADRDAAAETLGRIGGKAAVAALLRPGGDPAGWQPSAAVVRALGLAGDPAATAPLLACLADPAQPASVRRMAVQALGRLGDPGVGLTVLLAVEELDRHAQRDVDDLAETALWRLRDAASWLSLQRLLPSRSATLRLVGLRVLARLRDPRSVPALLLALRRPDLCQAAESAGLALARIGDPVAFAGLGRLVAESSDEAVFRAAVQALIQARHPDASAQLLAALQRQTEPLLVGQAHALLQDPHPPVDSLLEMALHDPQAEARRSAIPGLAGMVADPRVAPALLRLLAEDPDPEIRTRCVWTLHQASNPAAVVGRIRNGAAALATWQAHLQHRGAILDALIAALLQDASPDVRSAVAQLADDAEGLYLVRLQQAFREALATEKDPRVRSSLLASGFFRLRMEGLGQRPPAGDF